MPPEEKQVADVGLERRAVSGRCPEFQEKLRGVMGDARTTRRTAPDGTARRSHMFLILSCTSLGQKWVLQSVLQRTPKWKVQEVYSALCRL